jgi:anti-anti-sigma factor
MNASFNLENNTLTIRVPFDLISTHLDSLREEIARQLEPPTQEPPKWNLLQLDLSAAKMVDSVGLNVIITLLKIARKHQGQMVICYQNPNVFRTLVFTRLDQQIKLVKVNPAE